MEESVCRLEDRAYPGRGITRADSVCSDELLLRIRSATSTSDCGSSDDVAGSCGSSDMETGSCGGECGVDASTEDDCWVLRDRGYD